MADSEKCCIAGFANRLEIRCAMCGVKLRPHATLVGVYYPCETCQKWLLARIDQQRRALNNLRHVLKIASENPLSVAIEYMLDLIGQTDMPPARDVNA